MIGAREAMLMQLSATAITAITAITVVVTATATIVFTVAAAALLKRLRVTPPLDGGAAPAALDEALWPSRVAQQRAPVCETHSREVPPGGAREGLDSGRGAAVGPAVRGGVMRRLVTVIVVLGTTHSVRGRPDGVGGWVRNEGGEKRG